MELRAAIWNVLGFGVLPLWLLAGGADWLCHRSSHIERTSGPTESLFHLALLLSIAIPTLAGVWFEINALVLTSFAAGVAAHMALSLWDTTYSLPRRFISPFEQQVHSYLEMLPLFALVLLGILHLEALAAPEWRWVQRAEAIPTPWIVVIIGGFAASLALIIEEWMRALRRQRFNALAAASALEADLHP